MYIFEKPINIRKTLQKQSNIEIWEARYTENENGKSKQIIVYGKTYDELLKKLTSNKCISLCGLSLEGTNKSRI